MDTVFKVVTQPAFEAFSRQEAKNYLKVDTDADDTLIDSIIKAARFRAERYMGFAIALQTVEQRYENFKTCLPLAQGNAKDVVSLKYLDETEAEQTLIPDVYGLDLFNTPQEVYLKNGKSWPNTSTDRGAVRLQYRAGYDAAASIPNDLRIAMLLIISDMYENRTDSVSRFPTAAYHYLELYRVKQV
jgi:uncharacterized phiE125 gp8 family phage protein